MTTDPGDLVLDPTCGSGTTAYAAEQWGRRWITIDTSRVALALARARIMGARYSYYLLSDSRDGQLKEAEIASKGTRRHAHLQQHPAGVRVRAGTPHHAQVHCQQRRDRRDLGEVAGDVGTATRRTERLPQPTGRSGRFPGSRATRGPHRRRRRGASSRRRARTKQSRRRFAR